MAEGFLEALKHPERFETTCWDCHQKVHADLIEAERGMMRRAKKRGARRSLRSSRPA
jgi:5-methylcytosine-specific restriction endonuclease McrA